VVYASMVNEVLRLMPLSRVIQVRPASAGLSSARCMLLLEPQRQDFALISCMAPINLAPSRERRGILFGH
jgi:hypothetical protein